jgi:tetratricopeptide (TPR) repeat protein
MRGSLGARALKTMLEATLKTSRAAAMAALAATATIIGTAAHADLAKDLRDCPGLPDDKAGIAACTRLIKSGDLNLDAEAVATSNRGMRYQRLQRYRLALADFDRAIKLKPEFLAIYVKRGDVRMALGHPKAAIADYSVAIGKRPRPKGKAAKEKVKRAIIAVHIRRAIAYQQLGRRGPALQDINRAIALDRKRARSYVERGVMTARWGWHKHAMRDFDRAIKLNPKSHFAYVNRGLIYFERGQTKRAIKDFDKAIALDPNEAHAYFSRATARAKLKQYKWAVTDISHAIALAPGRASYFFQRAGIYRSLDKLALAVHDYTRAIELKPDDAAYYNDRGTALGGLLHHRRAIADFSRAIALDSKLADAYINRGLALEVLEEHKAARKDFRTALRLKPRDKRALAGLQRLRKVRHRR